MVAGGERCGLACPGEVERVAPKPRFYELGRLRIGFNDDYVVFEVVDGAKRLSYEMETGDLDDLYLVLLKEADEIILGDIEPTITAIYTVGVLSDLAAEWLRHTTTRRVMAEKRLREMREQLVKWRRLEEQRRELERRWRELEKRLREECSEPGCREKLWQELGGEELYDRLRQLDQEMRKLEVCEFGGCKTPPEALSKLEKQLADMAEKEKRLRIAALALSHAWRALTHPNIEDLERLYSLGNSGKGPLMKHLENKAAEEAELVQLG